MMQSLRRLVSHGPRSPSVWGARRNLSTSDLCPPRRPFGVLDSSAVGPVSTRCKPSNFFKHLMLTREPHASKWLLTLGPSGRSLLIGGLLGMSAITGVMVLSPDVVFAMDVDENLSDSEDTSDFLKQDLETIWDLTKRFQLPTVFLFMVLFGWGHPVVLTINVALLLLCTRPTPLSVYIFIEQLRQRAMYQNPGIYKTKLFYAKKVEIQDYKFFCIAKVEVRDAKVRLMGILGGWWVLQYSPN